MTTQSESGGDVSPKWPGDDRWRRFTFMDVLILVACAGVGFAFLQRGLLGDSVGYSLAARLMLGFVAGAALSVPLLLGYQKLFRGRWHRIEFGEWLGLSPVCFALLVLVTGPLGAWLALLWFFAQPFGSLLAIAWLCVLIARCFRGKRPAWTEVWGCLVALVAGPAVWWWLTEQFGRI